MQESHDKDAKPSMPSCWVLTRILSELEVFLNPLTEKAYCEKDAVHIQLTEMMLNIWVWVSNCIHGSLTQIQPQTHTRLSQKHISRQVYEYPLQKKLTHLEAHKM